MPQRGEIWDCENRASLFALTNVRVEPAEIQNMPFTMNSQKKNKVKFVPEILRNKFPQIKLKVIIILLC